MSAVRVRLAIEVLHVHDRPVWVCKIDRNKIGEMQQDQVPNALLGDGVERKIRE